MEKALEQSEIGCSLRRERVDPAKELVGFLRARQPAEPDKSPLALADDMIAANAELPLEHLVDSARGPVESTDLGCPARVGKWISFGY
jgi:hypothetical protein